MSLHSRKCRVWKIRVMSGLGRGTLMYFSITQHVEVRTRNAEGLQHHPACRDQEEECWQASSSSSKSMLGRRTLKVFNTTQYAEVMTQNAKGLEHHPACFSIIQHVSASSSMFQHHAACFSIIQHVSASSSMFQHYPACRCQEGERRRSSVHSACRG